MARVFTLVLLSLTLLACGGPDEYVLVGNNRSPSTDGMMIVEDTGANRMVTVELEHLPPPERLTQGGKFYVVWLQPTGAAPQMAGALGFDNDDRTGRMTATTPTKNFTLIVTVERRTNVPSPSDVVITKKVVRADAD